MAIFRTVTTSEPSLQVPKTKINHMQNSTNYRNKTPYFGFPHYNYLHIYKTQAECYPFIALFTC